jgi:hypothetical protein
MNKYLKIVAIAVLVLAIAAIFFIKETPSGKPFRQVELDSSNIVFNYTSKEYLDTIILAGLRKYGLEGIIITVYPLSKETRQGLLSDYDVNANLVYENKKFTLWVNEDLNRYQSINVLSHELVHLTQYYDGRLVLKDNVPYWKGIRMPIETLEYKSRPWEQEAIKFGLYLEDSLLNFLYPNEDILR